MRNSPYAFSIPVLALLVMAPVSARAEVHKCLLNGQVAYQALPCPPGSRTLPMTAAPLPPSAYTMEEARVRAMQDISEAEALQQRERQEAEARNRQATAAAREWENECKRLRKRIERAESIMEPGKHPSAALKQDRREYEDTCGPL